MSFIGPREGGWEDDVYGGPGGAWARGNRLGGWQRRLEPGSQEGQPPALFRGPVPSPRSQFLRETLDLQPGWPAPVFLLCRSAVLVTASRVILSRPPVLALWRQSLCLTFTVSSPAYSTGHGPRGEFLFTLGRVAGLQSKGPGEVFYTKVPGGRAGQGLNWDIKHEGRGFGVSTPCA